MVYDKDEEALWIKPHEQRSSESIEVKGPQELFGFGSGNFAEGAEAKDVMSDLGGRWVSFNVTSGEEMCILESDRRLPDSVKKADIFQKAGDKKNCNLFITKKAITCGQQGQQLVDLEV